MIFQNFGFNQKYPVVSGGGTLFPDQSLATFTSAEATQWQNAASAFNTTTYGYASSVSDLGSVAGGVAKYNTAALASNGKIYSPGHVNSNWLIVDTFNDTFTTSTAGTFNGDNDGCVFDKITGYVYSFGNGGSKINPSTGVSSTITGPPNRQAPGVQSFDGNKLYTAAAFGTSGIYEYNVSANTNTYKASQGSAAGDSGTLAFNGKIYFSSGGGTSFLEYDPATNTATNFGSVSADVFFLMITHPNGYVYAMPASGGIIKRIDPTTRTITDITATGYVGYTGCLGMDGKIYTVASSEGQIRYFDPATNTIGTISSGFADSSYQGIAMGAKGDLYVTPWSGAHVYKLALTTGTATAPAICQEYNFGGRFCWPG